MHHAEELAAALAEGGVTLVTANPRLARQWRHEFASRQLARGLTAWPAPAIETWPGFLSGLWQNAHAHAPLLTSTQESALWRTIVEESPQADALIQPEAAGALAREAWRLVQDWRIPYAGRSQAAAWQTTPEAAAFHGWAQQFQFHTRWLDRTEPARLIELLFTTGIAGAPSAVWFAGFDEWPPRARDLLAALEKSGTAIAHLTAADAEHPVHAHLAAFPDARAEEDRAAAWCRARLAANPSARIGVVVPDLDRRRHRFDRALAVAAPGAYHIAVGPPLADWPPAAAALRLLELGAARVPFEAMSAALLSPWTAGAEAERGARAAGEVALRRWRAAEITVAARSAFPPVFAQALRRVEALAAAWPAEQSPAAWARAIGELLDAFGWPGDRALGSVEYQAVTAWRSLVSDFASTSVAVRSVSRVRALALLRRLAAEKRFEVESLGEPIQVLSLSESAGAMFDHLWIAGMDNDAWPAPASPNPFIPLALQRLHNLPRSSPARELARAVRTSQRLLRAAPEVIVSYAETDGERDLAPAALFAQLPRWREEPAIAVSAPSQPIALEAFADTQGPSLPEASAIRGGTRALELQAKCPFRAFAEIRLAARELDDPEPGLDPRERGGFLHTALELFWRRCPSSEALRALPEPDLQALVEDCAAQALAAYPAAGNEFALRLVELEQIRLVELLTAWIAVEREREIPFTVEAPEQERTASIGGIEMQVRLDRLDRLPDGSHAIIDYKSRAPKLADWDGDRPESPQLPLYAATASEPLSAVAFAQVRTAENLFRGYATVEGALPGARLETLPELATRIDGWRRVLGQLGEDFRAGQAAVDPKDRFDTCEYCHLPALCRIEER